MSITGTKRALPNIPARSPLGPENSIPVLRFRLQRNQTDLAPDLAPLPNRPRQPFQHRHRLWHADARIVTRIAHLAEALVQDVA
jgi:hypothetical protein